MFCITGSASFREPPLIERFDCGKLVVIRDNEAEKYENHENLEVQEKHERQDVETDVEQDS